jgi:hypothetical protein
MVAMSQYKIIRPVVQSVEFKANGCLEMVLSIEQNAHLDEEDRRSTALKHRPALRPNHVEAGVGAGSFTNWHCKNNADKTNT